MENFLTLLSGIAWTVVYIDAIRIGIKDKSYAMPLFALSFFAVYREFVETRPPEVIANIAICLIHQANYLLDQQLRRLEMDFVKEGGIRERMFRARLNHRNNAKNKKRDQ